MRKGIVTTAITASALGFAAVPASASVIEYDVTDFNAGSGGSCTHGLWTNTRNSGCDRYFSFQDGSVFTVDTDTGTGTFTGTAINNIGEVATLDFSLGGFSDTLPAGNAYKKDGGLSYDPARIDFFTSATGAITIGGTTYNLAADPFAGNTLFQFGEGANAKTSAFGGSAWLNLLNPNGADYIDATHWDINFNLARRVDVPAPGMLVLFGLGALAVFGRRRRKLAKAA